MAVGSLALAFVAGVLSILSPCVLPILPIILGAAASEHKWGSAALAVGLTASFVVIGLFVATIGYSIGLDSDRLRYVTAALMIAIGVVLLVPRLQVQLAFAGAPLQTWSDRHFGGSPRSGVDRSSVGGFVARRGVEPVCRSNPWRSIDPRSARQRPWRGRGYDVVVWPGRRFATCCPRYAVARGGAALARADDVGRSPRKGSVCDLTCGNRRPGCLGARQAN